MEYFREGCAASAVGLSNMGSWILGRLQERRPLTHRLLLPHKGSVFLRIYTTYRPGRNGDFLHIKRAHLFCPGLLDDQLTSRAQTSYAAGMWPTRTAETENISVHISDKLAHGKLPFLRYQIWTTGQAGQAWEACRARPTHPLRKLLLILTKGMFPRGVCNKFAS